MHLSLVSLFEENDIISSFCPADGGFFNFNHMKLPQPILPKPLPNGNYDAIAYARASLARRAGIRIETLNRIERLKLTPSIATVEKLDRGMKRAKG
jgi:hypothetical protein